MKSIKEFLNEARGGMKKVKVKMSEYDGDRWASIDTITKDIVDAKEEVAEIASDINMSMSSSKISKSIDTAFKMPENMKEKTVKIGDLKLEIEVV